MRWVSSVEEGGALALHLAGWERVRWRRREITSIRTSPFAVASVSGGFSARPGGVLREVNDGEYSCVLL